MFSIVLSTIYVSLPLDRTTALQVSGLDWHTLKPCVKWMEPFYEAAMADSTHLVLDEQDEQYKQSYGLLHLSVDITSDESHILQTHHTTIGIYVSSANCV